jgi:hypothetical protein
MGFYDNKQMAISHSSDEPVLFKVQVDPSGQGPWMNLMEVKVGPSETFEYQFQDGLQGRWIRFITDLDCQATALLIYN